MPLVVYELSGSVRLLSVAFALTLLAGSGLAILGGIVADRFDRRRVLVLTYLIRLVATIALLPAMNVGASLFVVAGIAVGALGSFDNPSAEALLRQRMRHNTQAIATARRSMRVLSSIAGPAVGAALIGAGGASLAIAANALSFAVAIVLLAFGWRARTTRTGQHSGAEAVATSSQHVAEALPQAGKQPSPVQPATVLSFVRSSQVACVALASSIFAGVAVATAIVVAVPYLDAAKSSPPGAYGWALTAYAAGSLAGIAIAGLVRWRLPLGVLLIRMNVVYGACCALGIVTGNWWMIAVSWLLWGVSYGPEEVVADARVARETSPNMLGRIYASWSFVTKVAAGLGYVSAGALSTVATPASILLGTGGIYAVVAPATVWLIGRGFSRRLRDLAPSISAPRP